VLELAPFKFCYLHYYTNSYKGLVSRQLPFAKSTDCRARIS